MKRAEEWVRLVREESSDAWRDIIEQAQREAIEEAAGVADHLGSVAGPHILELIPHREGQ